ncbi:ABC transporter permease [Aquimarina gracilis]|uniref:ABC transporter permease n=1 Tax=Aquimarina gracilis TaxID=874422 RepID=A0ABU5ZZF5_9FLAO|nr:ABC transporter permease [Aquimarina gracilis]MEB3347208.1 ABC transporter permease [Aquimarina gracilis]
MFRNYIKVAWRNLKRQPFFTFLNTFGLALGMAGGILISLYIHSELSFDTMFKDADRIYRINADVKFGGTEQVFAEVSAPMAEAVQKDYPYIELTTRFRNNGSMLIRKRDESLNVKENGVAFTDSTFFKMFGIDLLHGDARTALTEPNTLVMTKTAAEKHFNLVNAVGQTLLMDNEFTYTVTGVIEDMPKNSFLRDHGVFMSMASYQDSRNGEWGNHNYPTFIKLRPDANIEGFQEYLNTVLGAYVIPWAQDYFPGITEAQFIAAGNHLLYDTIALTDIHLYSDRSAELSRNGSIQNVYILAVIAIFLIVLACVNFMNLSTAVSLKRAKEIGIRKTLGSNKAGLIRQFLTESGLISFISLLFSVLLATLVLPLFNELADTSIAIPFTNPYFWILLLISALLLGILSGSYPAFFMSKFVPAKVLKGSGKSNIGGSGIRNSLVVVQFTISIFLIVSTLIVFQQLKFIQNKDLGFSRDQVLVIEDVYSAGDQALSFKEEVQKLGSVKSASISSFLPTPSARTDSSFFIEGVMDQEHAINMQAWRVDHEYINTLGLEIIAGRDFDRQFVSDSTAIILNETAVKNMGVTPEEALGMRLKRNLGEGNQTLSTVIGVVKNFHFTSLKNDIASLSLSLGRDSDVMVAKLRAGSFSESIAQIERIWNDMAAEAPFAYYFMDESFNNTYQAEQRLGRIFMTFTLLSIIIACLGLFGLATFNAERRIKEIGIRKVLGASVGQITYKLSIDFLRLVGVAILVSLPLGWYAMAKWLESFSYRIEINIWVFVIATLLAIVISILTVSFQSIKAAMVNPTKSLRAE